MKKRNLGEGVFQICNGLVLLLVSLVTLYPFLYVIFASFSDPLKLMGNSSLLLKPLGFSLGAYKKVFLNPSIYSGYMNTVFYVTVGTLVNILATCMAAYVLSKFKFPGSKVLFQVVVLSLLFSSVVTTIPNYIIMTKLHMVNTMWALILPLIPSSLGLFLMKQFMDQMVPYTLLEAARLDGAGENRIFFQICLPLVRPAWMTLIIFSFTGIWNTTGGVMIFDEKLKTLPTALNNVVAGGIARTGVSAAIAFILVLPPVVVFLLAQSNVLQTMATSGLKD